MKKLSKKQRHQVKSRWYYIFWGAATVSVFAGQMYVGSGYRKMSRSIDKILEVPVFVDPLPLPPRHPMLTPHHYEEMY
tara:strand:+ start:62 stop:295 length:234 start_codon:yes stop_codon:yes gene_type:complete